MEKIIAMLLLSRVFERLGGFEPDLMDVLCDAALLTSVVSSWGVRSAMERRCRGANGEVCGEEGEEYVRRCLRVRRQLAEGRRRRNGPIAAMV